jgi:hypothetical protein
VGIDEERGVTMTLLKHVAGDVELSKESRVVAGLPETVREQNFVLGQYVVQCVDPVAREVLARPQAGTAGGADRVVYVTVGITGALLCEAIEVGRVDASRTVTAKGVPSLLVGEDQEDVGREVGHRLQKNFDLVRW